MSSHQYRHRSPFHLRTPAVPRQAPLVIVDGPSPLGTAASTFIALGLLGAAGTVHATSVAALRPNLRSRRLPTLAELADALARHGTAWPAYDVVGVGIGAMVALRLALDGGPVRRVVAVDAPVPVYAASQALATERFFAEAPRRPLARTTPGAGEGSARPAPVPDLGGALPHGIDPTWFRRAAEYGRGRWRPEPVPSIPDSDLTRVSCPVLCINSPKSAVVTGGDHVARLVPTSKLLRLSTMDTADENEQARVADALAEFLHAPAPEGRAYRAARPGVAPAGVDVDGAAAFALGPAAAGSDPVGAGAP